MSELAVKTAAPAPQRPAPAPAPGLVVQRKCACGGATTATDECEECRKKKLTLQPKLTIGAPNDRYEQEADRVADEVMRSPEHHADEDREPLPIQDLPSNQAARVEAPQSVHDVVRSPGQPLAGSIRESMERRFGHDFRGVRVHADARSTEAAKDISAKAFTVERHIAFRTGQYRPGSLEGSGLLAHELVHVVQQQGLNSGSQAPNQTFGGEVPVRRNGDREASSVSNEPAPRQSPMQAASPVLQRACGEEAIGQHPDCNVPPNAGFFIPGEIFRFQVSCDEFRAGEEARLAAFATGMQPDETVEVHGFASSDGGDLLNFNLACARAEKAIEVLRSPSGGGLPASSVLGPLNHGEVEGPMDDTRSVVLVVSAAPSGGDGVGTTSPTKICGPDITQWLIAQMAANESDPRTIEMRRLNDEDMFGVDAGALATWAWLVRTNGDWDFKRVLDADIDGMSPCRTNCAGRLYSVTLDGQCMTYEVAANIHFGYVGRHAGFSEDMLLRGASGAQVGEGRGEAADDPRDVQAIRSGFELFNAGSPNGLTKDGLDANYYENLPSGDGDPAGCDPCPTSLI